MTQPTEGFGQVVPRPRRARASAARIIARSVEVLSRREVAGAGPPSIVIRGDPPDKFAKILRLPEIAVDRGKADIGKLIKCRQRFHDQFADVLARNLGVARTFELAHQGIDDAFHPLGHPQLNRRSGYGSWVPEGIPEREERDDNVAGL